MNLIKLLFLFANGVSIPEIKELTNLNYEFNKHVLSVRINSENPYVFNVFDTHICARYTEIKPTIK